MIQARTLKGFRDFLPRQAIKRQEIIDRFRKIFEQFGFDPLETPALEYAETLMGKYGDEADKLLYIFKDNGDRNVGLRYDQTVPLSRVIAQYQDLPLPFKRYQIQQVWRAENTQKGRYREFLQCDIDTVGVNLAQADAEIIDCMLTAARSIGLPQPIISINDRTIFDALLLTKKQIAVIDKIDKIGKEKVQEELEVLGGVEGFKKLETIQKTERLTEIVTFLQEAGWTEGTDFKFDPFLARGLDYYTSTIFELRDKQYSAGSLAGGGRYDKLIGTFSGRDMPAVGVAFGFDRIMDALEELGLFETQSTATTVLVTVFSPEEAYRSVALASKLRKKMIRTEVTLNPKATLEKQLKYADKKGIPYVIIQGPEEKEKNVVNLKNMKTREEKKGITVEDVIKILTM